MAHSWLQLGTPGRPQSLDLAFAELTIEIDASRGELTPYFEMYHEGAYENAPGFKATLGCCVVDVGANIGLYAARQARRASNGSVVVFEPSPSAYRRLKRNVEKNHLTNVHIVNAAVGANPGTVHFIEKQVSLNCRVIGEKTEGSLDVPCVTLDSALAGLGIDRVDILKIDTEGSERAVLSGAKKILPRVGRIVLELHNNVDEEREQIETFLRPLGFRSILQDGILVYYENAGSFGLST
jgi:FkbM family methyltransferase